MNRHQAKLNSRWSKTTYAICVPGRNPEILYICEARQGCKSNYHCVITYRTMKQCACGYVDFCLSGSLHDSAPIVVFKALGKILVHFAGGQRNHAISLMENI